MHCVPPLAGTEASLLLGGQGGGAACGVKSGVMVLGVECRGLAGWLGLEGGTEGGAFFGAEAGPVFDDVSDADGAVPFGASGTDGALGSTDWCAAEAGRSSA